MHHLTKLAIFFSLISLSACATFEPDTSSYSLKGLLEKSSCETPLILAHKLGNELEGSIKKNDIPNVNKVERIEALGFNVYDKSEPLPVTALLNQPIAYVFETPKTCLDNQVTVHPVIWGVTSPGYGTLPFKRDTITHLYVRHITESELSLNPNIKCNGVFNYEEKPHPWRINFVHYPIFNERTCWENVWHHL